MGANGTYYKKLSRTEFLIERKKKLIFLSRNGLNIAISGRYALATLLATIR